jgi:hypothetical protein
MLLPMLRRTHVLADQASPPLSQLTGVACTCDQRVSSLQSAMRHDRRSTVTGFQKVSRQASDRYPRQDL